MSLLEIALVIRVFSYEEEDIGDDHSSLSQIFIST
jgi:hypothetical protein